MIRCLVGICIGAILAQLIIYTIEQYALNNAISEIEEYANART